MSEEGRRTGRVSERRQDGRAWGVACVEPRRRNEWRSAAVFWEKPSFAWNFISKDSELAHDVLSELANLHKTRLLTAFRSVCVCVLLWNV